MNSLVSVIIPVYNMESFVRKCVDSVISQTYTNLEIILVNDGSKDHSLEICQEIADQYSHVHLINQENGGVSVARNTGMLHATGKYLMFLDADDQLPENAVKVLVEVAEHHNTDISIGRIYADEVIPIGVFEGEDYLRLVLEDNPVGYYACRILFRREFVHDVTFQKGFVCSEDSFFVFECALKMPKVVTIDEQVYIYYNNPNSASRSSFSAKKYNDICTLLDKKETAVRENYPYLLPLFYHLKVKTQMMLLDNLSRSKGSGFRKKEKESLARFHEAKAYFRPELPYSKALLFKILSGNMFWCYKLFNRLKITVKQIIRR